MLHNDSPLFEQVILRVSEDIGIEASIIEQYSLQPFALNVQAAERTLIDIVFALADYYLGDAVHKFHGIMSGGARIL